MAEARTLRGLLQALPPGRRMRLLRALDAPTRAWIDKDFGWRAHPGQLPPHDDWRTWVIKAGRGFGKTRAGAEWVLDRVRGRGTDLAPPLQGRGWGGAVSTALPHGSPTPSPSPEGEGLNKMRIAIVAATVDEARRIMIEGRSGLLALARRGEVADWSPSLRTLRFTGGAEAVLYSGASPEGLRGPEHHFAWCDELAKWQHPRDSWDMLQLGLRLGVRPRAIVTTTPRSSEALRHILSLPDTIETGGASHANPHLPRAFLAAIEATYGGTRLGRQEIAGELLPDVAGALWKVEVIAACRTREPAGQRFERVVIGVDPPSGDGTCGIVACARDAGGRGHVIGDHSVTGRSPEGWARAVAAAAAAHGAHAIVAEANQGGAMVEAVLRAASVGVPVKLVRAVQGKAVRAEPVAALFEGGRVTLHGHFATLEAELCGLIAGGGYEGPGRSPDRADAMVWALTDLLLDKVSGAEPRIVFF